MKKPYSRGASPPNDAVAEERTEALLIPREALPHMINACPFVTTRLVHTMVDRARQFTSGDLRNEKLLSLGKLAAGLAHELNNPASAVVRSAKLLTEGLTSAEGAARRLASAGLSESQFEAIEKARTMCTVAGGMQSQSAMARADREDAITEWLSDHGASDEAAAALADSGITMEALDGLAQSVHGEALEATARWLAACCMVRSLSSEIESAASRIHHLVASIKGFTHMDQAPAPEAVDIRRGIADTVTMLSAKVRARSANVSLEFPEDLCRVHAVAPELNQVWMNLIDNALDAIPDGGHVRVSAARELDAVVVRITDDGAGIPPEIQARIFEPFYTTKGVGKGTGLGLDTVRRLLQRQEGGISVESEPGRTEFQVRLPVAAGTE
jgi:signal transduction histidine kinase